jgi:hypothetical protein
MIANASLVPMDRVQNLIYLVRGQKVLLDRDLAALYGVQTRVLNQAVRRNLDRFPQDFMFALQREEIMRISQSVISSKLRFSKNVLAFTEQGVAMLSSVLNSPRAIQVNIEIMRAFVRLRQLLGSNAELSRKLVALERKYDRKFKIVFDAIRELMTERAPVRSACRREIGFHTIPRLKAPRIKAKKF